MKLEKGGANFDAIWFNHTSANSLVPSALVDVVYSLEDNSWNGYKNLQLKIKDINQ